VRSICKLVAQAKDVPERELLGLIRYVEDRPGHDLRYAIDPSKVVRECGFTPKEHFDSGLAKTVHWYLENPQWVSAVRSGAYREWIERNYSARQ